MRSNAFPLAAWRILATEISRLGLQPVAAVLTGRILRTLRPLSPPLLIDLPEYSRTIIGPNAPIENRPETPA